MPQAHYGSLPFKEAIAFFRGKLNIPTERWTNIWQGAHVKAFVVAGAMKHDLLVDLRQAVDAAIADGKSLQWFKSEFNNIVAKHGWQHTGKGSWRARIIYQTNMLQSYNAGRYQQLKQFDYWQYQHGDSKTPRPHHLAWHNTILPKTDPWWHTHFPQNGWGCKCKVRGISKATLERKGLTVSKPPNDGTKEWLDKATGEIHQVPKGIDPGFDYNIGQAQLGERLSSQQMQHWQAQKADAWQSLTPSNYKTLGLSPKLPIINSNVKLANTANSHAELLATAESLFGKETVLTSVTPQLSVYINSKSLAEHIGKDLYRSRFLPLLPELIKSPQEVWASFEKHLGTGKVELRLRYIKEVKVDKNRSVLLVAQVVKGVIEAWTFITTKPGNYVNKQRTGVLLYSAEKS